MQTKKEGKPKSGGKTIRKRLMLSLGFLAILILLVFFLTPVFVSSGKGHRLILAKINNSIDGRTDFAALSMSWFKGVKITEFSFDDDAGQTSIKIKKITTKPHYLSFLTGALSFEETIIDEPRIHIDLKEPGQKQAKSSFAGAYCRGIFGEKRSLPAVADAYTGRTAPAILLSNIEKRQTTALPIKRIDLTVNNGSFEVSDAQGVTARLDPINSHLNLRPPGQQTKFDLDMDVADQAEESNIHAEAQVTPQKKTGWNLKGTTGDLTIEVNDLNLGSLGPIFKLAGVDIQAKGIVSADVKSRIKDGLFEDITATIKGEDLDVTGGQLKTDRFQTKVLTGTAKIQSSRDIIQIENLNIKTDWLNVNAEGTVPKTYSSMEEFLKSDSPHTLKADFDCDLVAATSLMPQTFGLKEGMKLTSGRLNGNIETFIQEGQRAIAGRAELAGLEGTVAERTIALSEPVKAQVEITSDKTGIKYNKLDLSASFAEISCNGTGELLEYNAQVNLEKLQSELGQFVQIGEYQMAGEFFSKGQISSLKDEISASGSSEITNLRLSSPEGLSASEPRADITFAVNIEPSNNLINIDSVNANATLGQVTLSDTVIPLNDKATQPMKVGVSASGIDLKKLQPFMVLFASFPQDMEISGTAESQFSISSKKDTYSIRTESTKIKNLKLLSPQQEPFFQEEVLFVFDGDYNPTEASWTVRNLLLTGPEIKIKGDFEKTVDGNNTNLQGQADLEYSLAAVGDIFSQFLPEGLEMAGKRQHKIEFAAQYPTGQSDKLLANLSGKANLGFEKAGYMGLDFGPTEVDIQVQKGLLKIEPFSTTVNNGQLNFAAQADFNQKPTLLETPGPIEIIKDIQINDRTTKQLLMYVNPVFANAVNVTGIANFACEKLAIPLAGADNNEIEVIGTISVNNLRLQASDLLGQIFSLIGSGTGGQYITIHPTRFVLQDGFLRYDDMQMDVGNNPINFKGAVGLDKSLNMTVTLPYTLKGRTVRVDKETVGERISLSLRGTLDKPELDTAKLLENVLEKELEIQLKKVLDGLFK